MGTATERWNIVDQLFRLALDEPPEDRAQYVRRAAAGDTFLEREVLDLIDACDDEGGIGLDEGALSGSLWTELATTLVDNDEEKPGLVPGDRVGAYVIVKEIGRGGMAVVYEAERKLGPMIQRYALKLVKRGTDTDEVVRRFSMERDILASLNHPNIARLYDGGVSPDGRPYFVMEYVDGQSISQFADVRDLSVNDRLDLFIEVGNAIQYAHRNLVVHRDLKPSNILVTQNGGIKLLDFGIAKVINEGGDGTGVRTGTGSLWMTPDYASPEQVRGENVTTSSDVYGLGLVLYELLTGQRPFRLDRSDPLELRRMICETEPDKPSVAVQKPRRARSHGPTSTTSNGSQSRVPERLSRQLRGDLDTIVMKALRKEPEDRYVSAEALVSDVRRFRKGLPVRARNVSLGYRVGKYLRRNLKAVAAISVLVVVIGSFGVYHGIRVTEERNIAQNEASKSDEVASFMLGFLSDFGPNQSAGGTVAFDKILREGVDKVERELSVHPEVQAQLYHSIGDIYEDYGRYDEAVEILDKSRQLGVSLYGGQHPSVAKTLALLGWTRYKRGEGDEGRALIESALSVLRLEGDASDIAATVNMLGSIYQESDEYERAEELFKEALVLNRSVYGDVHREVARTLGNLAFLYRWQERFDEAEPHFRESLRITRSLYDEHTQLAASLNGFGTMLVARGKYEQAEPLLQEALAMRRRLFGDRHPQIAESLGHLGALYQADGDLQLAERHYEEALAMRRAIFSSEHPTVANSLNLLGWLQYWTEDYEEAARMMTEAVTQYTRFYGERNSSVASALNKLGLILTEMDLFDDAENAFRDALRIRQDVLGKDHINSTIVQANLGMLLADAGKLDEAESQIREVMDIRLRTLAQDHFRVSQALRDLGGILAMKGEYEESETLLVDSYEQLAQSRGLDDPYTQGAVDRLIDLYQRSGNARRLRYYRALHVAEPESVTPLR